ncbi:MAG: 50S ribosomal protein L25 [Planctomycetaceae bacterium]
MKILDLPVAMREKLGSASSRRYRRTARIPCVLYGNRQTTVPLTVASDDVARVLKQHARLVRLRLGADEQTALVREVAWDVFGERVEHIDFVRVEMTDQVTVSIPVRFVGIPIGISQGGVLEPILSDLEVRCAVHAIPDEIRVDVTPLELHKGFHLEDIAFPAGVVPVRSLKDLLVHVVEPRKIEVAAPAVAEGAAVEAVAGEAAAPGAAAGAAAAAPEKGKEAGKEAGKAGKEAGKEGKEGKEGKDAVKGKGKGK